MHQAACGEDVAPFVPMDEAPVFVDRQDLEWPIDGLEPLAFVLARPCERLSLRSNRPIAAPSHLDPAPARDA